MKKTEIGFLPIKRTQIPISPNPLCYLLGTGWLTKQAQNEVYQYRQL
jgi:hypothetical protein